MKWLVMAAVVSCFLFGINLDDPLRGSARSSAAISFRISNQQVALDPLQGLVSADRTKRIQRTAYAGQILQDINRIAGPAAVIAGWWLADILVLEKEMKVRDVKWLYYTDEDKLLELKNNGWNIYYLPEQDKFNDLRFRKEFTTKLARPFPSGS
jgi:hypothetical protein